MGKIILLLSCTWALLCLFPLSVPAADTVEGTSQSSAADTEKEKETSLYLYYQKHLNPYFSRGQAKLADRPKAAEPKGSLASNPSSSAQQQKAKTADSSTALNGTPPETNKDGAGDRPYFFLNRLDSVGLEALNKTFPQTYRKEYLAELALGFKLTPQVDLSVGKVQKFERTGDNPWGTHDEGWRLRLQKNF